MSVSDSQYTSPDALRAKYLRPTNVLQNVDEATNQVALQLVQTQLSVANSAAGVQSGGVVGGSYGGGNYAGNNNEGYSAIRNKYNRYDEIELDRPIDI